MTETGRLFLQVLPSIVLPMFLAVVDQTIVAAALPAIAASLGGIERVSWVVVAYLVATTIAAPVYGQLRDVAGGRRMMFIGLAIFIAASVFCALATSIEMLIVGRVLQGLGGGGLMTLSQALIGETIPPRERGRYQGYLAAVVVTSSTFGPVAGGYLTQHFGWRSVFLINLPVGILAVLLTMRLKTKQPDVKAWSFDWTGLWLFVLFIAPILLALSDAHSMTASTLLWLLVLFAIGLTSLVLLLRHEQTALFPLIPVTLLRRPAIWRSDALAACHGAMLVSLVTFLPLYFRVVRGLSASETGLLLLPLVVSIGVGSVITGRLVSHTGYTTIYPSVGLVFALIGLLFLAFGVGHLSTHQLAFILSFLGLFMGTVMGVVQITVQRAAGSSALGQAAASVQFSRSVGAAFGTAAVGMVLFAALALMDSEVGTLFPKIVDNGPSILASMPPDRQAIISAEIAAAFRAAFLAIAGFACLAVPLCWSIPARRV